jgi:hypothetical protein
VALLGDDDPAAAILAAGAVDLRLGHDDRAVGLDRATVVSAPDDLQELRAIVESATGVGTWPTPDGVDGDPIRARIELAAPAAALGLLLSMEDLIERRSPWGRWRTTVDTMAARVVALDAVTVSFVVREPSP